MRSRRCSRKGFPSRPAREAAEEVDVYAEFQDAALQFIDTGAVKPAKVVLDGGNGMAGPMVGPILDRLDGLELVPTYWEPDGEFPDHEPNPLLPENREFIIRKVRDEGADLGIAWDGDADRCFFIDETGEFVAGDFLTALLAESVLEKRPGAEILYDIRASRAVADTVEAARRARARQPRRPRVLQDPHARRGRRVRRRGLRPLLLRRLLQRGLRHDPRAADPRAARQDGQDDVGAARPLPFDATSSPARSTPRSRTRRRRCSSSRSATRTASSPSSTASPSTTTTGTSTCGPPTPSRCCASPSSRSCPSEDMEAKRDEVLGLIRS